jgi:hypothetical protein
LIRSEATCSKATNYLKERGWKLHYDFVWYWKFKCWFLSWW